LELSFGSVSFGTLALEVYIGKSSVAIFA